MSATTTAVYAFSADPITFGHINVVERVAKTFDKVIVGIGRNPSKSYLLPLEERLRLASLALSHLSNVTVKAFQGMVVDFASEQGAKVIVKGGRNATDFDYEQMLHQVGISQKAGIDTYVLFADPALAHISSSAVKGIQQENGFTYEYVPLVVKVVLEQVISKQLLIGVTGVAGAGKSTLCDQLVAAGASRGIDVHNIDLDAIGHHILSDKATPLAINTRNDLAARFGRAVLREDGTIDRKVLGALAFGDKKALADLNEIMRLPMTIGLRKAMYGRHGVVLLNGALLVEANMLPICNNRIILVDPGKDEVQSDRLSNRGMSSSEVAERVAGQLATEDKSQAIMQAIESAGFGQEWRWNTSQNPDVSAAGALLDSILKGTEFES